MTVVGLFTILPKEFLNLQMQNPSLSVGCSHEAAEHRGISPSMIKDIPPPIM
jgi:hypothetical protein